MTSLRDQQKLMKRVLTVMSSRSSRERLRVTRLEDALTQAQQHHQHCEDALVQEQARYRDGRIELSEKLRTQTRTVADLSRYERDLATLNAGISGAQTQVRQAVSAEQDANTQLEDGRVALRQTLLREEKWAIAYRSLLSAGHHENG